MKIFKPIFLLFLFLFFSVKAFAFTDPNHIDDFDISGVETIPTTVKFSPDGKTMFIIGVGSDTLRQYSLSTAFDLSSSPTQVKEKDLSTIEGAPQDIEFNSDGTIVYVIGTENDSIYQWTLSSPYDIGSLEVASSKNENIDGDPRGLKFSNDGKKLFVVHHTGASQSTTGRVDEFTLTTPYDLDTIIKTNELTLSFAAGGRRQGINFSSDGYKLFITNSAVNSALPLSSRNLIREFSLNSPFNISNATNNGDFQPNYTTKIRLTGLTFNNDGSKMFHTDFTNNDIHEYTLSCGFGVKTCTDPTNDKDDVASAESQSEAAKKLIQHTTYPVLNRMEWLRRNSNRLNLTNQNIKFQFNNEILNSLTEELIPLYFSNNNSSDLNQNSSWSFWSEGTISIGKIGDTSDSSSKDINTSAITFGADKRSEDNIMRGIALRFGSDDVDVGDLGSALDMSSFSLTFYESKPKGGERFTDHLLGLSFINSDLINNSGSTSTDGERYGEQLYGSLSLRDTFSKNKLNFTPKIKINYGITHFGEYTETGAAGLNLKFEDQYIGNFTSSIGASLDNTYELKIGSLIPYFDFEYYADMSPSSQQKFSYESDGSAYTFKNINNATHNIIGGIGFDLISNNGLTLMTKYTRDQAKDSKNDNFVIALDYKNSQRSVYSMTFQDSLAKLSHNKELDNFQINLDSHYELFDKDPDYGLFIKLLSVN